MRAHGSRDTERSAEPSADTPQRTDQSRRPIWVKLLFAFLAVAGFMVAFAIMAISELRMANQRANELVRDQHLIEKLYDLQLNLNRGILRGKVLLFHSLAGADLSASSDDYRNWVRRHQSVAADATRSFPRETDADGLGSALGSKIRADVVEIKDIGLSVAAHYERGEIAEARLAFEEGYVPKVETLNRLLQTLSFRIRDRMKTRAENNQAAYQDARAMVFGASGFALLLALLLVLFLSASIIRPLNRIRATMREVAQGNFSVRADVSNRDELGELAQSTNNMTRRLGALYEEVETQRAELSKLNSELEEKVETQVREIERANRLRRFLPVQVAEMIVGAPDEAEVLRTRRTEITVLFADLRGFTAFANAATPDQVVSALNTFHATCGPLIEESGGTLERFLGDGLMVLFGAPVPMEKPAQRAVDLATAIRTSVREAMTRFEAGSEGHGLGVGIGVGTGAATLGQIGFEGRYDYSAIGPAPNLAARLCDKASDGQILISHATAWQVESYMKPAGPFDLKGVGQNIPAFELVERPEVD